MLRENKNQKVLKIERWHVMAFALTFYDIVAVNAAYFFALWVRFDCAWSRIPAHYLDAYFRFAPIYTVGVLLIFRCLRLYKSVWRFASYNELMRITVSSLLTALFHFIGITLLFQRMPAFYYIVGAMPQFILVVGVRFSYRFVLLERQQRRKDKPEFSGPNVMIIGAGAAGQIILRELHEAKETKANVCCLIDDDRRKQGRYIADVPIVGGRDDIFANVEKYKIDQIMLALPSATAEEKRDLLSICNETGCKIKVLPGIYQLVNGEVSLSEMKDVAVEDLLGRDPIKVDMAEIFQDIKGKTILVTGGGGSIGSELCRQIAEHSPKQLIIFEIYENNAYDIEQELKANHPELNLKVLIGSVRDSRRIHNVFETYHPDFVYHAATHKHVPLMETSPCESIKNNVVGTYKTAHAALENGCQKFVLISTDKAVNPTNIMGASKRLCEMVIQSMDAVSRGEMKELLPWLGRTSDRPCRPRIELPDVQKTRSVRTEFVAVRFGNVLGSNGSVIPLFRKQIKRGGPVTVTHPEIIRYFMTIPEAVSLVLQAGCYAKGGEIFVLDMGAPVKIDTLARNLIRLSGFRPDVDIPIVYTGLRPGEKLYEEKLMEEEGLTTTPNRLIHIGKPIPFDVKNFLHELEILAEASYRNNADIAKIVASIVPTFHSPESDLEKHGDVYERLREIAAAKEGL